LFDGDGDTFSIWISFQLLYFLLGAATRFGFFVFSSRFDPCKRFFDKLDKTGVTDVLHDTGIFFRCRSPFETVILVDAVKVSSSFKALILPLR
jgi:hypothetical protein